MANILIMDDEPLSLRRLFNVLCDAKQHALETADNLVAGVNIVEKLGAALDLLIIDISMFQASVVDLLEIFSSACPKARVLVLSPVIKQPLGSRYPLLRKPFTDAQFIAAVEKVLSARHIAASCDVPRKPVKDFQSTHRSGRARAAAR